MDERKAVVEAGYSDNNVKQIVYQMRNNYAVKEKIEFIMAHDPSMVASRDDREIFWTKMMLDPACSETTRLRASEMLGKAQGDFVEKREIKTDNTSILIVPGMTSPEAWEAYYGKTNTDRVR